MTELGPVRRILLPADLEARLPQPNSLRRAHESARAAVAAAVEALAGAAPTERTGLYVGLQQVPLDYCREFIDQSLRNPRLASPALFSESVANNAATHLSLTLGFRGAIQTFIGSRVAGIQALAAAAEDVEAGAVDSGLVVVLSHVGALTVETYASLYSPLRRRRPPPSFPVENGAAAFLVRPGGRGLRFAGVLCEGRGDRDVEASVRGLLSRLDGRPALQASVFSLARNRLLAAIRRAAGPVDAPEAPGESFALDPFLRLDGTGPRAVICVSEEGTAGLVAVD
jgi:hypothetical protein